MLDRKTNYGYKDRPVSYIKQDYNKIEKTILAQLHCAVFVQ